MIRLLVVATTAIAGILFVAFVASRIARSRTGLSIRMQVFLALACVVGAFAGGLGVLVVDRVHARAVRFASQAASDEANTIARLLSSQLAAGADLASLSGRLERERQATGATDWALIASNGDVLFRQRGAEVPEGPLVRESAPLRFGDRVVAQIEVAKGTVVVERLLRDFAPTVLVISLVLGAAAALSAFWIGRSIAAPIEALSRFSERVSRGQQGATPPPPVWGREVTHLTRSIDSMRRQLEGRPFAERFATDLSHELKNPVAAIRASAEVLQEGALAEPTKARHFVGRIAQAVARIERLLEELLRLARMEARAPETAEPVDLRELVETTALESIAADRVRFDLANATVVGEPHWLHRAIANLIENAAVHAAGHDRIEVSLERSERTATLRVSNAGEVPPHVRSRLFHRFVTTRPDKGGTGLGLAIVKAVAEGHGGVIRMTQPGPPRVVMELELPLGMPRSGVSRPRREPLEVPDKSAPRGGAS